MYLKLVEKCMGEHIIAQTLNSGLRPEKSSTGKKLFVNLFHKSLFFIIILIFKFSCDFYAHIFIFYSYLI